MLSGFVLALGLALGLLLGGVGLTVASRFRDLGDLRPAIRTINSLATAAMLISVPLGGWKAAQIPEPAWRLAIVAFLATPLIEHSDTPSSWNLALFSSPAVLVGGMALFWTMMAAPTSADGSPISLLRLLIVLCGGIGARLLGEALQTLALKAPARDWPLSAMSVALTLLAGGLGLLNLWQRGTAWHGDSIVQRGLISIWLAWLGAWMWPRRYPRIRAGLTVVAALLLISVAAQ